MRRAIAITLLSLRWRRCSCSASLPTAGSIISGFSTAIGSKKLKKMQRLAEIGRQLRLERASLSNPQRIDSIARKQLGMVVPAPGQLVTFNADAPLTIPVPQRLTPDPTQQAEGRPQPAPLASTR